MHATPLNAVDLACHSHPMARFLAEAAVALATPCTGFEWGVASALPFLPALRYGRTVLSPARWILTAAELPGSHADWHQWHRALVSWCDEVGLPELIYLGDGDRCIGLNTTEPSHRALLRTELERSGRATLRAAPRAQDLGWAYGRSHEVVIPVAMTTQTQLAVRWPGEVTSRSSGRLPGCDGQFFLKLYSPRDLQDAILVHHLPDLTGKAGAETGWFVRYSDPEDHLRLRFTVPAADLSEATRQISEWTDALRRAGLLTRASWDTYYPETARFGGRTAMSCAEKLFAVDSLAVLAQLAACASKNGPDPRAMTSASLVDIAHGLIGDVNEALRWLVEHTKTGSTPPPRPLYDQAVALADPAARLAAGAPGIDTAVAESWRVRRDALTAYRSELERAGTIRPLDLLPDLLHLHHARMAGPDLTAELACLHLSRAAARRGLAQLTEAASL